MIWHPGALALLAGSAACLGLLLLAAPRAFLILRRWDQDATTEEQFGLEKTTYLISALASWAFGVNLLSLFLFIATADDFSRVLAGAMCATGALNANPVGWWVLLVKALLLLGGGVWLIVNRLDNSYSDWPLLKFKYGLFLALLPLAAIDLALLWSYLGGLSPDVITSCCGRLFSTGTGSRPSGLAALDPLRMQTLFFGYGAGLAAVGVASLRIHRRWLLGFYALLATFFLPLSLASMISFIAPYIYQMPTHHCPFDIFQGHYGYLGYPLTLALAGSTIWGAMPAVVLGYSGKTSLGADYPALSRRWVARSLACAALFTAVAAFEVWFNGLDLF